jgi:hypothetical protein
MNKTKINACVGYEGKQYWIEGVYDEDDRSLELTYADIDGETNLADGELNKDAIEFFEYELWDKLHNAGEQ